MEALGFLRYVNKNNDIPELKSEEDVKLFRELKENMVIFECGVNVTPFLSDPNNKKYKTTKNEWQVSTILAERIYGIPKDDLW